MSNKDPDVLYYSPKFLATRWSVSQRTIHNMAKDGRLESRVIANRLRIPIHSALQHELGEKLWNTTSSSGESITTSATQKLMASRRPSARAAKARLKQGNGQKNF